MCVFEHVPTECFHTRKKYVTYLNPFAKNQAATVFTFIGFEVNKVSFYDTDA